MGIIRMRLVVLKSLLKINMHCSCCDRLLNDYESTLKHAETGEYLDTCMKCLDGCNIPIDGREDLNPEDAVNDYPQDFEE